MRVTCSPRLLLTLLYVHGVLSIRLDTRELVVGDVTQHELVLPCEHVFDQPGDGDVGILWSRQPGGGAVLQRGPGDESHPGEGFGGRARWGHGCSLILTRLTLNDTGLYTVEARLAYDTGVTQVTKAHVTVVVTSDTGDHCHGTADSSARGEQRAMLSSYTDRELFQRTVLTLCCLVLVYAFLGLTGAVYIESRVTNGAPTGSREVTHQLWFFRYMPLLIGIVTFVLAFSLSTSGIINQSVTAWIGLGSGFMNTVGAAMLVTHDFVYQDSYGLQQKLRAWQRYEEEYMDSTCYSCTDEPGFGPRPSIETLTYTR